MISNSADHDLIDHRVLRKTRRVTYKKINKRADHPIDFFFFNYYLGPFSIVPSLPIQAKNFQVGFCRVPSFVPAHDCEGFS